MGSLCPCLEDNSEDKIGLIPYQAISLNFWSSSLNHRKSSPNRVSGCGLALSRTEIDQDSAVWEIIIEESAVFSCGVISKVGDDFKI